MITRRTLALALTGLPLLARSGFAQSQYPTRPIRVVVLNSLPDFSAALPANIRDALATRFPHMERVGPFEVRWRD